MTYHDASNSYQYALRDRYTLLSGTGLTILREYRERYHPKKWLFEGAKEGDENNDIL